jgi:hypothetical protein
MQKVDAGALNWEDVIIQISVYGNKEAVMKNEHKTEIISTKSLLRQLWKNQRPGSPTFLCVMQDQEKLTVYSR